MTLTTGDIDLGRLARYLRDHLEGFEEPLVLDKFAGGQSNPTYLLRAGPAQYVLRRQPFGTLLKSAHAIDREYRVMTALHPTAVPVPRTHLLCTDASVIGSQFFIMDFVPGNVFWSPSLPELTSGQRRHVYSELVRVLAELHDVDIDRQGLSDFGRRGNYFERQLAIWTKQYRASETGRLDAIEELMMTLATRIPPDDGQCSLIHGDYRLDNIVFDGETLEARAVLDWELSTLGHPLADLAYLCAPHRLRPDDRIPGLRGLDRTQLGIPGEAEIVATYRERRQLPPIRDWSFYVAFSFFRLAAIVQGVYKRALDGNASNERAQEMGETVAVLARAGVEASWEHDKNGAG